ncbi:hypothetical protein GNI_183210 [Gregarina niphandrodes]|uniref:Uncharacterized protein n=1 Tax=Gregarina niphandrodes TaxID=110365 RepID=A0A023AWS3_GRENI|nr:hypothetical protein GNI_183210 [Gregarina niphandrodes]EZG43196.1 hypothetical protein GNI_183210 [Gregarina niphandrodes]|eukprot:XP_011133547.1 hypothetical protein GNI_183210 [Gregarina niphandrodes]
MGVLQTITDHYNWQGTPVLAAAATGERAQEQLEDDIDGPTTHGKPHQNGPVRQKGIRRRVTTIRPEVQGGGARTLAAETNHAKQKRLFEQNTLDMDGEHRERLWELLEFNDTREDPKVAQAKYEARFEVSGRPHKARLRHYEPEMLEELKKQVAKQLELGVIRPSKSEWAAAPRFAKKKT